MPVTGSRNGPFGSLIQFLCLGFRVEGSETTCSKVVLPLPFSEDFDDEVDGGDGSEAVIMTTTRMVTMLLLLPRSLLLVSCS